MEDKIRSPILVLLGHVDHGKTTLLDKIRGTAIAKAEPGAITQHISASYVPVEVIEKYCGPMLERMNIKLSIPGLLWIDSPGHEAFTTLRKRGGAIADLAVLVVDANEGFKPQTYESLNFLKQFKTPFVVALTKIDKLTGWIRHDNFCFTDTLQNQPDRTIYELEEKLYRVVGQLSEQGFKAERFDRVKDFSREVCIVPVSGITGEGIPDLLMVVSGIAQKFLTERLKMKSDIGKGTVLEVEEFKGLGVTIDVILYDGEIKKGDYLVIGSSDGVINTRIKSILVPEPLKDMRMEKKFRMVDFARAAAGVKIAAPGLEKVIAGLPLRAVRDKKDVEKVEKEVMEEVEEVEIETDKEGVLIKADTLGSLEALIKTLKDMGISIRKAKVGDVTKSDILEFKAMKEPVIFAFCVRCPEEVKKLAEDNRVKIFVSNVIYKLVEDYQKWVDERKRREEEEALRSVSRPGRIRVLPGYVFRQCKPAVFGVEVLKGIIKPGVSLKLRKKIAEIKEIQSGGENISEAKAGEKVAISMEDVTVGRDLYEGDTIDVYLRDEDIATLKKLKHKLTETEKELLDEILGEGNG